MTTTRSTGSSGVTPTPADATTAAKGVARILGGTADAPTVPYTAVTGTPTIPTAYTDEQARDALGAALVAGSNVTITPNDAGDTITIAAATTGSSGIPAATVTTKGDLLVATASGAVARLPVGSTGQVLSVNPATATGLQWINLTGGGGPTAAIDSGSIDISTIG